MQSCWKEVSELVGKSLLQSRIEGPTRVTYDSESVIDQIFHNGYQRPLESGFIKTYITDHFATYVEMKINIPQSLRYILDAISETANAFTVEELSKPPDTVRPWFTKEIKENFNSQELYIQQLQAL